MMNPSNYLNQTVYCKILQNFINLTEKTLN